MYEGRIEPFSNKEINIVLVCVNHFQPYILTNIKQMIRLSHKNIYVITNRHFFDSFHEYPEIHLIDVNELEKSYNEVQSESTDFWHLTSSRFMYIYEFMKRDNIENVIHVENDVLVYYNCNLLNEKLEDYLYLPFDSSERTIASIMYIPNHSILKEVLDHYDYSKNDMENFAIIQKKVPLIKPFPIIPRIENEQDPDILSMSENYNHFQYVFDAAAIGQYLGGEFHNPKDTVGFINETCIIKYNRYSFEWKEIDQIKKPFLIIDSVYYPIFNLHIHSKELEKYV